MKTAMQERSRAISLANSTPQRVLELRYDPDDDSH